MKKSGRGWNEENDKQNITKKKTEEQAVKNWAGYREEGPDGGGSRNMLHSIEAGVEGGKKIKGGFRWRR